MSEQKTKPNILILVAIIGATATCIDATIELGQPFVHRLVDIYLPATTLSPSSNQPFIQFTSTPAVFSTPQSVAESFDFGGLCAAEPVNALDYLEVQLDPSRWYLVEEFDNNANPPTHVFRSQVGNVSVTANAVSGIRAWECRGELEAISEAQRIAIRYKQDHPSHKVIGPDGQQIE